MITTGKVVALIQAMGGADPAVIKAAVQDWLDAHPEATTTVQDGSITEQKLATSIAQKLGLISSLSDEIDDIGSDVTDLKSAITSVSDIGFEKVSTDNLSLGESTLSNGVKRVIAMLPENTFVTKCQQVIAANSNQYCKLEIWEETNGVYSKTTTITGTVVGSYGSFYLIDFGQFSIKKKSFLTYLDTSSSGFIKGKGVTGSINHTFENSLTSVTVNDFIDTTFVPGAYVEYYYNGMKHDIAEIEQVSNDLVESVHPIKTVVIQQAGSGYVSSLSNAYVWMILNKIPQGTMPKITVHTTSGVYYGDLYFYFFKKNANDTYSVVDYVMLSIAFTGDHIVPIPAGVTDDNDIYVGVYSNDNGIGFKNDDPLPITRCGIADITSEQITMSGSYDLNFNMDLSYDEINPIDDRITALESGNSTIFVKVDASGNGKYTSLLDAMNNEPEGTVLYVMPGVYNQDMTSCLAKRVIVIGSDRNQCIIRDTDGRSLHHPLYVSCGYFENLTIIAEYVNGESHEIGEEYASYAVHADTNRYAEGKQLEFHHCNIISDFFPAIGAGLFKDATLILDDCILENRQISGRGDYSGENEGTLGALYFHDSNYEQGDQYILVKGCVLKSKLKYAMCPYQVSREVQNNHVICDFINNVLYSDIGKYADTVWFRNNPFDQTTGIFELRIGYGNSIASLNN